MNTDIQSSTMVRELVDAIKRLLSISEAHAIMSLERDMSAVKEGEHKDQLRRMARDGEIKFHESYYKLIDKAESTEVKR